MPHDAMPHEHFFRTGRLLWQIWWLPGHWYFFGHVRKDPRVSVALGPLQVRVYV